MKIGDISIYPSTSQRSTTGDVLKTRIDIWNLTYPIKRRPKDPYKHLLIRNVQPESISDNPAQASFDNYSVAGRSSSVPIYSGGDDRKVSFSLKLSREMCNETSEKKASELFYEILDEIKAYNYPMYSGSGVVPPNCYCVIGGNSGSPKGQISIKGYASTSVTYLPPIDKYGRYMNADVSFDITEVAQYSFDSYDVVHGAYVTLKSNSHKYVR